MEGLLSSSPIPALEFIDELGVPIFSSFDHEKLREKATKDPASTARLFATKFGAEAEDEMRGAGEVWKAQNPREAIAYAKTRAAPAIHFRQRIFAARLV
ncbi:MAG: hypothetical protein ACI9R3_003098 [Verrucomicrobiales bacterium]